MAPCYSTFILFSRLSYEYAGSKVRKGTGPKRGGIGELRAISLDNDWADVHARSCTKSWLTFKGWLEILGAGGGNCPSSTRRRLFGSPAPIRYLPRDSPLSAPCMTDSQPDKA
jgi:hypothetical protein